MIIFVLIISLVISGASLGCDKRPADTATAAGATHDDLTVIAQAYQRRQSNIIVSSAGSVEKILPDDLTGERHQRFIIRLANGQTVLVSHNIDIAPRLNDIRVGDEIRFKGEYEWNEQGGVVHWTHRDPRNRFPGGWLEHKGRRYQ